MSTKRYVVIEQPQLDWLSVVRIPLGVALLVTICCALVYVQIVVLRAISGDFPSWAVSATAIVALTVALYVTNKVISRIRPRGARTKVELTADTVRYWDHRGVERAFVNRGLTKVSRGVARFDIEVDGGVHRLPIFVEQLDEPGLTFSVIPGDFQSLQLACEDGQVVLYLVRVAASATSHERLSCD